LKVDDEAHPSTEIHRRNQRKTTQIVKSKIRSKMPPKIMKIENVVAQDRRWFDPKRQLYWCKSRVYKVWKSHKHPPTLWKIGEISHFSPLFFRTWITHQTQQNEDLKPTGWERDTSHNSPKVVFIAKIKRLKCPYGLKGKLQLMRGNFVWLPLCHTWCHQIVHLLASLPRKVSRSISTRAPCHLYPPVGFVAQPINHSPLGFEAQTKKPSRWFRDLNHQIITVGFEVQTEKPEATGFEAKSGETVATGFEAKPEETFATSFEAKPGETILMVLSPNHWQTVPVVLRPNH
jgi:hypothetical protein